MKLPIFFDVSSTNVDSDLTSSSTGSGVNVRDLTVGSISVSWPKQFWNSLNKKMHTFVSNFKT